MLAAEDDSRYVAALQADARVLVAHLAGRGDKSLGGTEPPAATVAGGERLTNLTTSIAAISTPAQEVARSPAQLSTLVQYVDLLSRQAFPANARTIQITQLYSGGRGLGGGLTDNPDQPYGRQVRHLRWVVLALQISCLFALICVLALFALAETGRQSMAQLERGRDEIRGVRLQLEGLPTSAWTTRLEPNGATPAPPPPTLVFAPGPAATVAEVVPALPKTDPSPRPPAEPPAPLIPAEAASSWPASNAPKPVYRDFCPGRPSDLDALQIAIPATYPRQLPSGTREGSVAFRLCSQLYEARIREDLIFVRLHNINCNWFRVASFGTDGGCDQAPRIALRDTILIGEHDNICGPPESPETARCAGLVSNRHWSRTEIRTAGSIYLITALVLPLLMGFLGGCTFVFRRISAKVADSSLDVRDGLQSVLRVLMAMLLGGLVGVLLSGGEAVNLAGFSMTLAAVAFFVGFSVEPIFAFVENMVRSALAILEQRQPAGQARAREF